MNVGGVGAQPCKTTGDQACQTGTANENSILFQGDGTHRKGWITGTTEGGVSAYAQNTSGTINRIFTAATTGFTIHNQLTVNGNGTFDSLTTNELTVNGVTTFNGNTVYQGNAIATKDTTWTNVTFGASWKDYGGVYSVGAKKYPNGTVGLRGLVQTTIARAANTNSVAFTLPAGYCVPSGQTRIFNTPSGAGAPAQLYINGCTATLFVRATAFAATNYITVDGVVFDIID